MGGGRAEGIGGKGLWAPVEVSQMRRLLSAEQVAASSPSWVSAAPVTSAVCPVSRDTRRPVSCYGSRAPQHVRQQPLWITLTHDAKGMACIAQPVQI